jgi:hypothetical protein
MKGAAFFFCDRNCAPSAHDESNQRTRVSNSQADAVKTALKMWFSGD